MLKAITLVHKGAMEIAIHSIRTFAYYFSNTHHLVIHVDPSIEKQDCGVLLEAAKGIEVKITTAAERNEKLNNTLIEYPKTKSFLNSTSYYTKLEIPLFEDYPYFFFDSDVIWLRHVIDMKPKIAPNAFSTETWTSYHGMARPHLWIKAETPQRVNSGMQYIGGEFPIQKLEYLLSQNMFDKRMQYAGDQEIFAYLYNDMEYFHPKHFKRSRVGSIYNLQNESCAALHFAGRMWRPHLDQILKIPFFPEKSPLDLQFLPSEPLSTFEFIRMHLKLRMGKSKWMARPLNFYRKIMRAYR